MSQPIEAYPNTVARQSSSNPNGSFGPVFVVLAIIFVLSAVACVLGRLCSRRHHRVVKEHHRVAKEHQQAKAKQSHHPLGPKEWESRQKPSFNMRDGDIEFGFDKKIPTPKMGTNGNSRGPQNGGFRGEVRFAHNIG
ncbi:hypothetical protein Fot_16238 [Forsythia ovata]|uniref:Transmembrane protein n=1 Tax=Forsythia ovata TaxID=205694 RepID=A0ABD1WBF4_9LAMI